MHNKPAEEVGAPLQVCRRRRVWVYLEADTALVVVVVHISNSIANSLVAVERGRKIEKRNRGIRVLADSKGSSCLDSLFLFYLPFAISFASPLTYSTQECCQSYSAQ